MERITSWSLCTHEKYTGNIIIHVINDLVVIVGGVANSMRRDVRSGWRSTLVLNSPNSIDFTSPSSGNFVAAVFDSIDFNILIRSINLEGSI